MVGEKYDPMRVDLTLKKIEEWYVGDGWYSDGERFHFDYYNLFVIQPMLVEILEVLVAHNRARKETYPGNFAKDGYLTIGFVGHQPELGDWYSNNGSMYITTERFLALSLPADDFFWTAKEESWTMKAAFSGEKFQKDYAVNYYF